MRGVLALAVIAIAPEVHAEVAWTAPAGCPSEANVRTKIESKLGELSLDEAIDVTVTRTGRSFTASIVVAPGAAASAWSVAGPGTRTLTAARCDELADAVALIVARLATEARRERPTTAPTVELAMPAMTVRTPAIAITVPAERPLVWTGGFRALALSGIGMTPDVGVGADVAVFVQRETRFAELGYARWAPRPMQVLANAEGAVDFDIQLVALRGGWASTRMPLRAWAGVELGQMHGSGPALRTPESGVGRWVAIASGFGVGWPISPRTRLVGTFEVAVPLDRAKFQFMDGSEIREPAPISARSALGLELAWR